MKKLLLLLLPIVMGCTHSEMEWKYDYVTTNYKAKSELPLIKIKMEVVEQKAPNIFVIETSFSAPELVGINAISLVIQYDNYAINFMDEVTTNGKLWINEFDDIDSLGITLYNDTGKEIRYSFATLQDTHCEREFIFRNIVEIKAETELIFSKKPGEMEFMALDGSVYPLQCTYLKFKKK